MKHPVPAAPSVCVLTVIVRVFNEEAVLVSPLDELREVWRVLYVDDGNSASRNVWHNGADAVNMKCRSLRMV